MSQFQSGTKSGTAVAVTILDGGALLVDLNSHNALLERGGHYFSVRSDADLPSRRMAAETLRAWADSPLLNLTKSDASKIIGQTLIQPKGGQHG